MKLASGAFALVISTFASSAALAADFGEDTIYTPRGPLVVVPPCDQNMPPIGVACIPRAAVGGPDPLALRDSVDLDKLSRKRPYRQLFNWDP